MKCGGGRHLKSGGVMVGCAGWELFRSCGPNHEFIIYLSGECKWFNMLRVEESTYKINTDIKMLVILGEKAAPMAVPLSC